MIILLNDEIFPANLLYLRKRKRLSQIALARQSGICVHYLRAIERRRFLPRFQYKDYVNLCCVLDVSQTKMGSVLLEKVCKEKEMTLD